MLYIYIYDISRLRVNVLYNLILVALDKSLFLKRLIAAKLVLLPAKIRLCIYFCTLLSLLISVPRYKELGYSFISYTIYDLDIDAQILDQEL